MLGIMLAIGVTHNRQNFGCVPTCLLMGDDRQLVMTTVMLVEGLQLHMATLTPVSSLSPLQTLGSLLFLELLKAFASAVPSAENALPH